jgi:hypothetical protein
MRRPRKAGPDFFNRPLLNIDEPVLKKQYWFTVKWLGQILFQWSKQYFDLYQQKFSQSSFLHQQK